MSIDQLSRHSNSSLDVLVGYTEVNNIMSLPDIIIKERQAEFARITERYLRPNVMESALSLRLWNFIILKLALLVWVLLSFYDTILNFRLSDVFLWLYLLVFYSSWLAISYWPSSSSRFVRKVPLACGVYRTSMLCVSVLDRTFTPVALVLVISGMRRALASWVFAGVATIVTTWVFRAKDSKHARI
jgi:hypothetical protein